MNIVFVAPRYHTNQVPIVKGLVEKGCEVRFYVYYEGGTEAHVGVIPKIIKRGWISRFICFLLNKRYSSGDAETKRLRWYMPSLRYFIKEFKMNRPEVVILRDKSKSSAIIFFICKLMRIKNVIIYNQYYVTSPSSKNIKNIFFPKVRYTPTDAAVLNSSCNIAEHTYFVPFVYEVKSDIPSKQQEKTYIKILDIGKFRPYKNHHLIIDAVAKLSESFNIKLTIVGQANSEDEKNYLRELYQYVSRLHLEQNVDILSNIPYAKMDDIYRQNDILVLCSHNELAGMVVLEAMANGLCTISPDNNGTACYVTRSNGGGVYIHSDLQSLIETLIPFLNSYNSIVEAGNRGREYIKTKCNFDAYWNSLNDLCRKEFGDVRIK